MRGTKNKLLYIAVSLMLAALLLGGCGGSKMKDGFYTAEMSEFEFGWKEYVCILVKDEKIVSAEFNAKDPNGYVKAWDNEYMRNMKTFGGMTYPNEYTRAYVEDLLKKQTAEGIDTVSGATTSGGNFKRLAEAVIAQAKAGSKEVAKVAPK